MFVAANFVENKNHALKCLDALAKPKTISISVPGKAVGSAPLLYETKTCTPDTNSACQRRPSKEELETDT